MALLTAEVEKHIKRSEDCNESAFEVDPVDFESETVMVLYQVCAYLDSIAQANLAIAKQLMILTETQIDK